MKPRYFVLSVSVLLLFAASLLHAQEVKPASVTIQAVPGQTSPQQKVVYFYHRSIFHSRKQMRTSSKTPASLRRLGQLFAPGGWNGHWHAGFHVQ